MRDRGKLFALSALVAFVLAGCGVSSSRPAGGPSQADPASVVPASALLYYSMPARLQGQQGAAGKAILQQLFGADVESKIEGGLNKLLRHLHKSYSKDVKPWLGGHLAFVVSHFPSLAALATSGLGAGGGSQALALGRALIGDIALIAPTDNPSAARAFVNSVAQGKPAGITIAVHGHWVLIGGAQTVSEIEGTNSSDSLASSSAYRSMVSQTGSTQPAASIYLASGQLAHAVLPLISAIPTIPSAIANAYSAQLSKIPTDGSDLLALTLASKAVRLDILSNHPGSSVAGGDVGKLAADSWLALDTGPIKVPASLSQVMSTAFALSARQATERLGSRLPGIAQRLAGVQSILQAAVGAIGPVSLSLGGTAIGNAKLGVALDSANPTAARTLLSLIFAKVKRQAKLRVQGSPTSFSFVTKHGEQATVTDQGGKVVGLIGYPNAAAFTSPSAPLSQNAVFHTAVSQLPSGGAAELFLNFGPLTTIATQNSHGAHAAQAQAVLKQLSYVIVGGTPSDHRIVLGLS